MMMNQKRNFFLKDLCVFTIYMYILFHCCASFFCFVFVLVPDTAADDVHDVDDVQQHNKKKNFI